MPHYESKCEDFQSKIATLATLLLNVKLFVKELLIPNDQFVKSITSLTAKTNDVFRQIFHNLSAELS